MNESNAFLRLLGFRISGRALGGVILTTVLVSLSAAPSALAAEDACMALNKLLGERIKMIQHVQSYKDKRPTADEACTSFTQLAKLNVSSVTAVERDGTWCRAPEGFADNLKTQQAQIEAAKTGACKAAAEQKKAQASGAGAPQGPLGGTGDVLGGPMKLPQGAL